ncbi:MAG: 50S ribosomal protein L18 [Candidatus Aminicenantes bacterium]|nr:50S ribosomal protein L18 [Candidatus Aminicenantes bacterium]
MHKNKVDVKKVAGQRIRKRIRKKISGTEDRPRVYVHKSNRYIYIQAVNDINGYVMVSACTLEKDFKNKKKNTKNLEASKLLGELIAKRLKEKKLENIVFDRGIYPYHGRVKMLAEAMREAGLKF